MLSKKLRRLVYCMGDITTTTDRDALVSYLKKQVIGPVDGDGETISEPPHRRYLSGILFPREAGVDDGLEDDIIDDSAGEVADDGTGDPIALAAQQLPSSVALSFVLRAWRPFRVEISAGRYADAPTSKKSSSVWRRTQLTYSGAVAVEVVPPAAPGFGDPIRVEGLDASLSVRWRRLAGGALVTVALRNDRQLTKNGRIDPADCLFQVEMRCHSDRGLAPYPVPMRLQTGDEEEELRLLYRDVPTYAIGHGAAAVWEARSQPSWAETSFLPSHVVPGVAFELDPTIRGVVEAQQAMDLERLSQITSDPTSVIQLLDHFVDCYETWAQQREEEASALPSVHEKASRRVLERINEARRRMRRGVRLLERDDVAREAFALANGAMIMQMVHGREDYAGRKRRADDPRPPKPSYEGTDSAWRPFQLAFLLLTIESVTDDLCPDRDVVDLIWFPTGGGKTEAYLGLMAFTVFFRRLTLGDNGAGTTVITRYTLRLLTSQQFQRAATLVCACELLRRSSATKLGTRPISIGVWLGGSNSPNTYADAVELLGLLKNSETSEKSFQVDACPWCGTELAPEHSSDDEAWGIHASNDSFRMNCPSPACEFHGELPVSSVDHHIYEHPPTVLIGTVDKFARLTWDHRAGVLLGSGDDPPPSLIVQDEFHLISGPLGTMVGLYEAAFEVLMEKMRGRPKVVASTATIRRAEAQSLGVFGRPATLFPPPGLSASNSYFVRTDTGQPGRQYLGLMAQGHTPLTAMVHVSAALLQASEDVPMQPPADDAYWTLVAYHNSLRELGKTITLAHDDIPARLKVIADAEDGVRNLNDDQILELTSNVPPSAIPGRIETLKRTRLEKGSVSFVASTNMLSVGVDVPRLGLMLIVGQPKTTAEYIQASSRVGRRTPGLVCTLYSSSKPRDRSHYESFIPYHSALYRHVEPTSVTPFSIPARHRALHAGLVILVRHALGLGENDQAAAFSAQDADLKELLNAFLRRVAASDPEELSNVDQHLGDLTAYWEGLIDEARSSGGLRYQAGGKQSVALLRRFNRAGSGWPTLDSMRSVDTEVRLLVRGADHG